jgi:D-aminoacyl-tRNA deacylase
MAGNTSGCSGPYFTPAVVIKSRGFQELFLAFFFTDDPAWLRIRSVKALIQRVSRAQVTVNGEVIGKIGGGLVALVGVAAGDAKADIEYLVNKIVNLRIFADADSKFNLSLLDVKGELLLISQFTLMADTRKGRRPSFTDAAPPEIAEEMFNDVVAEARKTGIKVETGKFQAHMMVELVNDGPVTIMLDSGERLRPRG